MSVFRCKSGKYPPLLAKPLNRGRGRWSGRVAWVRWPPVKRPDKSSSRMHAALLFLPRNKSTDGPRRITLFILNRGLAKRNTRPQIFNQVSIQNWLCVLKASSCFPRFWSFVLRPCLSSWASNEVMMQNTNIPLMILSLWLRCLVACSRWLERA